MIDVGDISDRLADRAEDLASQYLPNGRKSGNYWMFSGIDDAAGGGSAYLHLGGAKAGKWFDMGSARPGEDKGDLIDLIRLKDPRARGEVREAIRIAKSILGIADVFDGRVRELTAAEKAARAAEAQERARRREEKLAEEAALKARRARALFLSGRAIAGTPAERYLRGRGIDRAGGDDWPGSLRFHDEVWNKAAQVKMPAMLAGIFDAQGRQMGTHRTYLEQDAALGWIKARGDGNAKMVLGSMWGGFIPIAKGASGKSMRHMDAHEPVYATEGIEDALVAAMIKPEARVVAAISLGNLGAMLLPMPRADSSGGEAPRRLVIVADRDSKPKAQEQLEKSIAQQQARGVRVELVMPPAEVNGRAIKDLNDWWQALCLVDKKGAA